MVLTQVPAPGRAVAVRRRGAVYAIPTLAVDPNGRPIPGAVVVGYVGQTRQTVKTRELQHRACQPFGDLILGGSWVVEEGTWTDAELDERERHHIRNGVRLVGSGKPQRPIYNYEHNLDNPRRVEVWRAVQQRQVRQPGWVRPTGEAPAPRRPVRRVRRFRWTPWRVRAAAVASVWLALFAGLCWAGAGVWHGWALPRDAAVGSTVVLVTAAVKLRPRRRRGRVRRRRR